jgi:AcrR family transcriptional regulator
VRQPGQIAPAKIRKDRRVQRTQRLLQAGLRTLLGQKSMEEIAVHDITEAANVNRATFYDHYTGKLDLFNALIAAEFQELLQRRNVCFDGSCGSGLAAIVLAVGDYLQQIHSDKPACIRHAASGPLVDAAITLAIRGIVLDGLTNKAISAAVPREVFASMLSGTIYGAVKEWLSARQWKMEEDAILLLVPLIQPLLAHSHPGNLPA